MNKRYRLGEIEEAVAEMEERIDIEDDIAEIDDEFQIVVSGWSVYCRKPESDTQTGNSLCMGCRGRIIMPDLM